MKTVNRSSNRIPTYRLELVQENVVEYDDRIPVRSPSDCYKFIWPYFKKEPIECVRIVMLNTAHHVIGEKEISRGGIASAIMEPRSVFIPAMMKNAAVIIIAHNHPSGNPEPSREDIDISRRMHESGKILGIPVRDFLIVTEDTFVSFAERGLML